MLVCVIVILIPSFFVLLLVCIPIITQTSHICKYIYKKLPRIYDSGQKMLELIAVAFALYNKEKHRCRYRHYLGSDD
mgnify:CR=1 FL=1